MGHCNYGRPGITYFGAGSTFVSFCRHHYGIVSAFRLLHRTFIAIQEYIPVSAMLASGVRWVARTRLYLWACCPCLGTLPLVPGVLGWYSLAYVAFLIIESALSVLSSLSVQSVCHIVLLFNVAYKVSQSGRVLSTGS